MYHMNSNSAFVKYVAAMYVSFEISPTLTPTMAAPLSLINFNRPTISYSINKVNDFLILCHQEHRIQKF